jgi:hypothetical protein
VPLHKTVAGATTVGVAGIALTVITTLFDNVETHPLTDVPTKV